MHTRPIYALMPNDERLRSKQHDQVGVVALSIELRLALSTSVRQPPAGRTTAAEIEHGLPFSNHLSRSFAFHQSLVLKLLVASLSSACACNDSKGTKT